MFTTGKNKKRIDRKLFIIAVLFVFCSLLYYLPTIVGFWGSASLITNLNLLHNFYGIDFYALIFFVPVVYAAYSVGVIRSVIVALATMIIFTPYSIVILNQPEALFRPSAFVIILSAVGAVVAMLQKSDLQRQRSLDELNCLYNIGKTAEKANSVESFLREAANIICNDLSKHGKYSFYADLGNIEVKISDNKLKHSVNEKLYIGGEERGYLEISYSPAYKWDKQLDNFVKTLAERVGGAIYSIELEQSLKSYYEQLETMVENRTRELEIAHEKLVRSERLAAVGELASGVGHELRNPLNVIRNCVYLINMGLEGKDLCEVEDSLKLLDQQIDISNNIVTDLMDFTRVKKPQLNREYLNNLIKERVSWANVPDAVDLKMEINEEDQEVYIDREQCGRAFTNIINNAVQAVKEHGEIIISSGYSDNYAWVSIKDNGCGIDKANLEKIFEPLYTTKNKGIGLGLAVTKRMVEQNNGEIEVKSKTGNGTTFIIKLPLAKKENIRNEEISQNISC